MTNKQTDTSGTLAVRNSSDEQALAELANILVGGEGPELPVELDPAQVSREIIAQILTATSE